MRKYLGCCLMAAILAVASADAATFTVNDTNDYNLATTLRAAINLANANPGPDIINFGVLTIPPGMPITISPTGALPSVTDQVTIDGTTQTGVLCPPGVEIEGSQITGLANGLELFAPNCVVRGLVINRFSGNGILISAPGASCMIVGNYIGTDLSGTVDQGNGLNGIRIYDSPNNSIGFTPTSTCAVRNVISGNGRNGVAITQGTTPAVPSTGNLLQNNYIGTDVNGMSPIPNDWNGVVLDGVAGNDVGSKAAPKPVNLISANKTNGVYLLNGSSGNDVFGNYIGTDVTGMGPMGNGKDGVLIDYSAGNTVGGDGTEGRNVISGNGDDGLEIFGTNSIGNTVHANYIGTDAMSFFPLPNADNGVVLTEDCTQNAIGGTVGASTRNVISGNNRNGVVFDDRAHGNFLYGNYVGLGQNGLAIVSNREHGVAMITGSYGNYIGNNSAEQGNVISGNGISGSFHGIFGDGTERNTIARNLIGLNIANGAAGNKGDGVRLQNSVSNNVGSGLAGYWNVISGNGGNGVRLGTNSSWNLVDANIIGLDTNGASARPNGGEGVYVFRSDHNTIGGYGLGTISGNQGSGVRIGDNARASDNTVIGNYIGTDIGGVSRVGNSDMGVWIENAPRNVVGIGGVLAYRNVISGNDSHGVQVEGSDATGNAVYQNFIGTTAAGTGPCTNGGIGVYLLSCHDNYIGQSADSLYRNVIAGNGSDGVQIRSSYDNVVEGNIIGADAATNPLPNMGNGLTIWFNNSSNNLVGSYGMPNLIAWNIKAGIRITSGAGSNIRNKLEGNLIYSNAELGIDLDAAGVSPNDDGDADTGANNVQNYPVIYSATTGSVVFSGMLDTDGASSQYRIFVYANDKADASGFGEGQYCLGYTDVVTDVNGDAEFINFVFTNAVRTGQYITVTARSPDNDTSEFSPAVEVVPNDLFDADGDGMPGSWESGRGLDPNDATGDDGAAGDPDEDETPNFDEYVADTDPQDGSNYLHFIRIEYGTPTEMEYTSTNSRYYVVGYSTNLASGTAWRNLYAPGVQGANGTMVTNDASGATNRSYRVQVQMRR